ncbi:MAG: hypothetical protein M1831_007384 [Alyxoria varia]|nr:MAG: hypothetical protein M1831_007384 [Alyxoria varia]
MKLGFGFALQFFKSQLFTKLPYPEEDWSGKTVIVTGSNTGLGLEAARHYARLKARRVILAVRNVDKGRAAKRDIDNSLPSLNKSTDNTDDHSNDVVQVWQLDLSSQASVKEFAARCTKSLDRIDAFVANAGISPGKFEKSAEGDESTIAVNVISDFLLAFLLMPKLKETATKHSVRPTVVIVASEAHFTAQFKEKHEVYKIDESPKADTSKTPLFDVLKEKKHFVPMQRYPLSKLLEILVVREFAVRYPAESYPVTVNCSNPGLCHSELTRDAPWALEVFKFLLARKTEVGSRTSVNAAAEVDAAKGPRGVKSTPGWSHGKYLSDCRDGEVEDWIDSEEGKKWQKRVWEELNRRLESAQPGVMAGL